MIAGIEAGGTKVMCAVGTGPDDLTTTLLPTTMPDETLDAAIAFLRDQERQRGTIEAIGIASFGPLDLRPDSPTYGTITTTPKPGWAGTDLVGRFAQAFDVPIGFDTDVNGAALAEHRWGAAVGLSSTVYVTIGTGIGGGVVIDGRPLHGLLHPEMGHLPVVRHPDDPFRGVCPFHGACLEGLASGPAIEARFGRPARELGPQQEAAIGFEAFYLAQLAVTTAYVLSPERIILGGGVMGLPGLLDATRARTLDLLGGYLRTPAITDDIGTYLVAPALGGHAGVLGALLLADHARASVAATP